MTLVVASPADEPFGPLHPDFRYHGFREGNLYWSTIGQYVLAARLASERDREQVRMNARDPGHAAEMARAMARVPDEDARATEACRAAIAHTFSQSLPLRAVLLSTGDAPIAAHLGDDVHLGVGTDGRGANAYGLALMVTRAAMRARSLDEGATQCVHQDADELGLACVHALESRATPRRYHRAFTGRGADYHALCEACAAAAPAPPPLRRVCRDCFENLLAGHRLADVGEPEIRARPSTLRFQHTAVRVDGLVAGDVVAIAPVARRAATFWVLDRAGALFELDVASGRARAGGRVAPDAVDLAAPLVFVASPDGELVALGEAKGRRAVLLDPVTGAESRRLDRGDYHEDVCRYPLAFAEPRGRLVLVHATAWNRLDALDARTGEVLTARESPEHRSGEPSPPHYLDYFHAGLTVSPDGERVVDDGWIWHPYGEARVFSVRRWLEENPWESEDGPSVRTLAGRAYFWDGPVAWLDATTVAVWGAGDDDENLTPAARIFDAVSGDELGSFPGPARGFAFVAPWLVAFDDEHGAAAWDPATGERLGVDPTLAPLTAHPLSGELVSRAGDALRVTRLVGA